MSEFLDLMSELLDYERAKISESTDFRLDVESFDSMKGFAIIITIEEEYGARMPVDEFLRCQTVGDIFKWVEMNRLK